jgi:hypothetical protein
LKLVDATRNGKRFCGAIVPNKCQADAVLALAKDQLRTDAFIECEKVQVTKVLMNVKWNQVDRHGWQQAHSAC